MFEQGAMPQNATCSTHIPTEEEDVADLAKDEADKVRPMKITPNFGKKTETIEEHSEEEGSFHAGLSR